MQSYLGFLKIPYLVRSYSFDQGSLHMRHARAQILSLLSLAVFASTSCEDESSQWCCQVPTGEVVSNQLGRVYRYSSAQNSFYYIGDPDTTLRFGGYLLCNDFPKSFIPASDTGVMVIYSGRIMTSYDAEEPAYFGIELTSIRSATQEFND